MRQVLIGQRRRALASIAREREATVITLIHRQESLSLLGFPLACGFLFWWGFVNQMLAVAPTILGGRTAR